MFRVLLLAVALGLSAGGQRRKSAYSPNKEYWYDYETQVVTGIPKGSKIYSGLKFKATAKLQFETAAKVLVKFDDVEMYKINDMIDGLDPTRQQIPEDLFQQLSGPETADMVEKLAMPLKFSYIRGHISDLQSNQNDPYWSMDIKRGFLSLLEVNLEERQTLNPPSPISYDNDNPMTPGLSEFYTVLEPSVAGECETFYRRMPLVTSNGGPYIRLNKIRNYNKCVNRPAFTNTMFNEYMCAECEKDRTEPLRSTSEVYYYLRGMDRNFIIESAIAESQHIYTQYSEEGGSVATFINQTLMLTKTNEISEHITPPQNPRSHPYSLRSQMVDMEDPREQKLPLPEEDSHTQDDTHRCMPTACAPGDNGCRLSVNQQRTEMKIQKMLTSLSAFTEFEVKEEATSLLADMLVEFRRADYSILMKFWTRYGNPSTTDPAMLRIRKILIDMLPTAGTPAATYVMTSAIEATQMTQDEAAMALNYLAVYAMPDICVAKWIQKIVELPWIEQHTPTKISAWLCMGAVVNKINTDHGKMIVKIQKEKELLQKVAQSEKARPIKRELEQKLAKQESKLGKKANIISRLKEEFLQMLQTLLRSNMEEDNIIALKTIGNAGFSEFFPDLKTVINDKSKPYILRSQAMFALRRMIQLEPEAVRNMLLPRFFDKTEPEPIRIVAFYMFFSAQPPKPMLEMAVQYLDRETNPNIGTFVYSLLEQYSNSSDPCLMSMVKNSTWAMRFAKKYDPKYHYSRYMHSSLYDDNMKIGIMMDLGFLSSSKEFIPASMAANFRINVLGRQVDIMEVGYNSEGLQKVLSKMMGPYSLLKKGRSPLDILEPRSQSRSSDDSSDSADDEQPNPIRDIHEKLNVSPRQSPETEGHIYFKLFGNEISYTPFDYKFIERLLRQGKIHLPVNEEDLRLGTNLKLYKSIVWSDVTHMFASEAGFPIRMNMHGSSFVKVEGTFSVTASPALFKKNRHDNKLRKFDASFNLHPSAVMDMEGTMMVDAFYFKSGASVRGVIQAESPLHFNYGYDAMKNKFYTNFDVSNLKEKFMKLEMKPYTFVRKEPFDIHQWPTLPDTKDIDVAENAILETVSEEYGSHEFGLKFATNGQKVKRNFLPTIPYCPFSGKQMLYFTVQPGLSPPTKYQLEFMVLKNQVTDRSSSDQSREQDQQSNGYLSYLNVFNVFGSNDRPEYPREESTPNIHLQHVIEKLRGKVPILQDGEKYAYSVRLTGIGSSPMRYYNLETLFQKSLDGYERRVGFLFKRAPFPQWETEPFQWDMDIKMTLPRVHIEPSKLTDPSYLEELHKQIQLYVKQDGKPQMAYRIEDMLPAYQDRIATKMQSWAQSKTLIDDLIQDIVKKTEDSADPVLKKLIELVEEQTQLQHVINKLKNEMYDKKYRKKNEEKYMSLIHRSKTVADLLNEELDQVQGDNDDLRKPVLVKYSVYKQQHILRNMLKMYTVLKDMLPVPIQADTKDKLKVAEIQLHQMIQKENRVLLPELQDSPMLDIKQNELKEEQERVLLNLLSPSSNPRLDEVAMSDVPEVIKKASIVERKVKDAIAGEMDIPKPITYKILEATILQKQVVESMQIKMELVKEQVMDKRVPAMQTDEKEKFISWREAMKTQVSSLSKILANLISKEEESSILLQVIPSSEHPKLQKLLKVKLLQPLISDKLEKIKGKQIRVEKRHEDKLQLLQECLEITMEIKTKLQDIVGVPQSLSPQLLHIAAKVMQTQIKLLEQLKEKAHLLSVYKLEMASDLHRPLKALKDNLDDAYLAQVKYLKKALSLVDKNILSDTDQDSALPSPRISRVMKSKTLSRHMEYPQRLYLEMNAHAGPDNARTKVITIEMIGKKSLAQIFWEKDQFLPLVRDELVKQYLRVKESGEEHITKSYRKLEEELNTFRHFHFSIDYNEEEFPEYLQLYSWRYREFLKYKMFNHMRQYFPEKTYKPNYMELVMDIERNNYQVNMDMMTPYEVDRFQGMLMPFSWKSLLSSFQPKPFRNSILPSPLKIKNKLSGVCEMRKNMLTTLDAKEVRIPDSKGCDFVLAMDCSSSTQFAIKARKLNSDPIKKAVTVMIENKKIEVIPRNNKLVIKVDGVKQMVSEDAPFAIKKDNTEGRYQPTLIEISKKGPRVHVHVPIQGTEVVTDGEWISIQVSPFYYSKVCGLCGDYDGNPYTDNKDPQRRTHEDTACLLANYVLSNGQCEAADVKRQCNQAIPSPKPATCHLEKRTEVRTMLDNICFSTRPVNRCVSGCRPQQQKSIRMQMICKDRQDPQAEELRQASHQRVLRELRDQTPTDTLRVRQDESCL
ncbi:vitellogenin-6-like isoform X2 [Pecten maximus]|uniref:vitellogenin-6-like isoform X2 n=1 Tax=Pecten maximus TaxID=6579 RepID=UPI001458547D|nr:vitellogenin-6-like isoform X2 [Pecten maximus]